MSSEQVPRWGNEYRERKAELIFNTIKSVTSKDINRLDWLDVGCGSGGIAASLASKVNSIIGCDPEPWSQWTALKQRHNNLDFVKGCFDLPSPPVSAERFDIVVCNQVYEHVDNAQTLIKNIYTVLKPGGICYFAGPNLLWPIEPHVFWPFVHWIPRTAAQKIIRLFNHQAILDANSATSWVLKGYFLSAGFTYENIIHHRLIAAKPALQPVSPLIKIISNLTLPLMPGFVFLLKKPND